MKTIYEKNGTVEIPYPLTKFTIRSSKNVKDNLWTITVFDPLKKEERKITENSSKTILKLIASCYLDTNIEFSQ